ncbi:MAG: hypothetical protein LBG14_05705 [Treponema sp.]|jgi:hypothetical protein|nr:hypothetical protein [Treponema sp.]
MKKRLSGLSKTAAAVQVLGLGLLLLISCNNILVSPREGEAVGDGQTGSVALSFGNGVEGARTLLPSGVSFQLYKLAITPESGQTEYVDVDSASPPPIELAAGAWSIHVDAYTDSLGNNKAAAGDSKPFVISANQITQVSITLNAVTGAGNGTLSVDISGASGVINNGGLYIYKGTNFNDPVEFSDGVSNVTAVPFSSGGLDMDISLPAGQYRVAAHIYNNEGQGMYINEVAYIYSNLTTGLDRVISADDFIDVTTISGTVQYQENGVDQSGYSLNIFTNSQGTGMPLGGMHISDAGVQPYTIRIPRPDKDVPLYFYISKGLLVYADSLDLAGGQQTAEKNIFVNRSVITLSGSIGTVTVNGQPPEDFWVYARTSDGYTYLTSMSAGTWQINIPGDVTGTFAIGVSVQYAGGFHEKDIAAWTSGSPTAGIPLGDVAFGFITLNGTIGMVTVNGQPPEDFWVYARTLDGSGYQGSMSAGTWQVNIPGDVAGTLIIGVDARYAGEQCIKDLAVWNSGSATTGFNLGNVSITISSISGTVTTNGTSPLARGWLYVVSQPNSQAPLGCAEIINGSFSGHYDDISGSVTSGYVVIVSSGYTYITSSPVTLGASMNFNLSAMNKLTGN